MSDENKNWKQCQTHFSTVGPTYFELWVIETKLWMMEIENPNNPLYCWNWNFFTESTIDKSKDNWNIIIGSINSNKNYNNTINNSKNNLNSKKTGFLSQCQVHTMYDFCCCFYRLSLSKNMSIAYMHDNCMKIPFFICNFIKMFIIIYLSNFINMWEHYWHYFFIYQ